MIDDEKIVLYAIYMFYMVLDGDKFQERVHALISLDFVFFMKFLRLQRLGYLAGCEPTEKTISEVSENFAIEYKESGYNRVQNMMGVFNKIGEKFLYSLGDMVLQIYDRKNSAQAPGFSYGD